MPAHALRDMHLYLHSPVVVMKARVNLPSGATYPITTIPFDTVSVGAYTDVQPDSFFIIGSADGLDDRGRGRVQNVLTATNLPVGRLSRGTHDGEIDVYDGDFIIFYDDFKVVAKIPFDNTDTGIDYKDGNEPVSDHNVNLPPVANMGAGFADYIDPDTDLITVSFDASDSYAMADGATIVSYAWDIGDGSYTVGSATTAAITATFPAGFRYVALTVVDSNDNPMTTRRPILAVDPANDPTEKFQVESHRIEKMGQTISFDMLENIPRTSIPDGCLVLFWWDIPLTPADRGHMKLIGWHQSDSMSIRATPTGNIPRTTLNCVDVAGRLAALPGFPQALQREAEDDVDIMWSLMPGLDMRKCLWYLAFWHSTALGLADFFLPDDLADYPAMRLDSTGASLYEQINSRAQSCVPDHWLTCNTLGQLSVLPDWMLLDFADRPVATAGTLTEDFWTSISVDYQRPPKYHILRSSAVICSTTWLELGGEDTLPLAFCVAPGTAPGQGVSEATTGEKLTISQEQLNHCEGHRLARLNAHYGLFNILEPSGDIQAFEPAAMLPVQVNISAATAAQRGLDFTTARGLVKSIDLRYNHTEHGTWVSPTIQWEREVIGLPAVTHIPEVPDDPDFEVPEPPPGTVPPDNGLIGGQEMVAGIGSDGYIYRTSDFQTVSGSGGPTWDRVDTTIADTIYSFVVDPFSPAYINGSGAVNGWIVNDTDIYRVTDLFGTPVATSVYTFDEPTVAADFHWRSIQASFGAYFAEGANPWLLCVSYYGDTAGHTGTWATRSTDGGVTWSAEVQISAFYDFATPTRFNPIGLFTSPRTPGFALTAAHVEVVTGPLPRWGILRGSTYTLGALSGSATANVHAVDTDTGLVTDALTLIVAPPPNTKRMVVQGFWNGAVSRSGAVGDPSINLTRGSTPIDNVSGDVNFTEPAYNAPDSEGFSIEWSETDWATTDWPINTSTVVSSPPTTAVGSRFALTASLSSSNPAHTLDATLTVKASVTLIELDDGTIYNPSEVDVQGFASGNWGTAWAESVLIEPGEAMAGSIHIPWESNTGETLIYFGNASLTGNREFRLKKSDGGVISDISPVDTGVDFGVNLGSFGIRAYDSDRQYLAMGGIGNDTSDDPADDLVGLWVSSNAGAAWANILAPVAASNAPRGLQIAFSGTSENTIFSWGGLSSGSLAAIYYSTDLGSTLDPRDGNLESSFGDVVLIGLAGGPTG